MSNLIDIPNTVTGLKLAIDGQTLRVACPKCESSRIWHSFATTLDTDQFEIVDGIPMPVEHSEAELDYSNRRLECAACGWVEENCKIEF